MTTVKYMLLNEMAQEPRKAYEGDSGFDLYATEDICISRGETKVIPVGIALEIPAGYEGQIRGRSSLQSRGVLTHLGTIDSGYRGEIKVTLTNLSSGTVIISKWHRVAQICFKPVVDVELKQGVVMCDSERGDGGHGSSGK